MFHRKIKLKTFAVLTEENTSIVSQKIQKTINIKLGSFRCCKTSRPMGKRILAGNATA